MNQVDQSSILAQGADATADFSSIPYTLNGLKDFSIQVVFDDSSCVGTLQLQGSNDPRVVTDPVSAVWIPIEDSDQTVTAGAPHMWNVHDANYKYVRFTWDEGGSGAGTLTAFLEIKYVEG